MRITQNFKLVLVLIVFSAFAGISPVLAKKSNDPFVEQWSYERIGLYNAWDYATGSHDVIVAVLDNGFDSFHPDLRNNVWKNEDEIPSNGVDDDKNGYIDDVWGWNFHEADFNKNGVLEDSETRGNNNPRPDVSDLTEKEKEDGVFNHGTLVAGIIGAQGNNGRDGAGVNWNVRLMNLKVLGNKGIGSLRPMSEAVYYAVDNGADVINISMVGTENGDRLMEALTYAFENGVVVVAAAGNDLVVLNDNPLYPICSDAEIDEERVLGVSAIDEERRIARFSNTGSDCVDIAAPGVDIASTVRFSPTNGLSDTYLSGYKGTSFAAPFISGAAALIKSVRPDWGAVEIFDAILKTVMHTPGQDEVVYANLFGAGLIQIDKALAYAIAQKTEQKITEVEKKTDQVESKQEMPASKLVASEKKVLFYKKSSGEVSVLNLSTRESERYFRGGFKSIDDLAVYQEGGKMRYVIARKKTDKLREIKVYNERWISLASWTVPASGELNLAIGNFSDQPGMEIVLAPNYSDDQIFRIFSFKGEFIAEYSLSGIHGGVDIAINTSKVGFDQILTLYKFNSTVFVERFDSFGDSFGRNSVNSLVEGGSISVGDLDGDSENEIALVSGSGKNSSIFYYELDGGLLRNFYGYDYSFTGGINVNVFNYNSDLKDEAIITSMDGTRPVSVWSNHSRRLAKFYPFGEDNQEEFEVVPLW